MNDPVSTTVEKRIKTLRKLALISYLGLFVLMLGWTVLLPNPEFSIGFQFGLYVVPLLFPMVGIIKGKPYTHAWANFILMWYFLHSLTVFYIAQELRFIAAAELILTIGAFIGCTYYARLQGRAQGLGLKKLSVENKEERERFEGKSS